MLKLSIEFKITCNKWEWGSLPGGEHRQFGAVETLHLKIHFPSLFPQHSRFSGYQQEAWSYLCPLLSLFQPVLQRTHILVSSRSWRKIVLFRRTRSRGRFLISQEMFLEQTLAGLRSLKIFTTSHFSVTSCFTWYKWACLVGLFFPFLKRFRPEVEVTIFVWQFLFCQMRRTIGVQPPTAPAVLSLRLYAS